MQKVGMANRSNPLKVYSREQALERAAAKPVDGRARRSHQRRRRWADDSNLLGYLGGRKPLEEQREQAQAVFGGPLIHNMHQPYRHGLDHPGKRVILQRAKPLAPLAQGQYTLRGVLPAWA